MKWVCAVTAPWALGVGLLVSFTAEAGNNPQSGLSSQARQHMEQLIGTSSLVPHSETVLKARIGNLVLGGGDIAVQASLRFDAPLLPGETVGYDAPKTEMKKVSNGFPEVNREGKGAPAKVVRDSLSRRALDLKNASVSSRLAFARDERILPPTIIVPGPLEPVDFNTQSLLPFDDGSQAETTRLTSSVQSPAAAAAGSTGSGRSIGTGDGASPVVARAWALSSATPAPFEAIPIEVAAAPVSRLGPGFSGDDSIQPNYTSLVTPANWEREKQCLAEVVYFEARSEPPAGQAAVAEVVLNRVRSGLYPSSICGVVYQNRHRHLACQFTFACEGKTLRTNEPGPWAQAKRVADEVLEGKTYLSEVGGSTHYHADYVKPYWAKRLKRMDVIGRHIFYKLRPGQT